VNARQVMQVAASAVMLTLAAPWADALAADAKVTPLVTHDLGGLAGKEGLMALVEYPPGAPRASTGTMRTSSSTCSRARS
jgi:hypothetical protein